MPPISPEKDPRERGVFLVASMKDLLLILLPDSQLNK